MKKGKTPVKHAKKRPLTQVELAECERLNFLYQEKKGWLKERGIRNQAEVGSLLEMGQAAVSQYLNGINALNKEVAMKWAKLLEVEVAEFSERLAEELRQLVESLPKEGSRKAAKLAKPSPIFDGRPITASEALLLRLFRSIPEPVKPGALAAMEALLRGFAVSSRK